MSSKPHIGIFGRRNNGKSSLINAIIGQEVAIVDATAGTTTDPVRKAIEIFGIGPCIIIDTAGIDDVGDIGAKRVQKSMEVLKIIDLAILVITDYEVGIPERQLLEQFRQFELPYLIVNNKCDLNAVRDMEVDGCKVWNISTKTRTGIDEMLQEIVRIMPESAYRSRSLLGDLINEGDEVLLVTPIDSEAPEGRMILPQVQMIRDVLDNEAIAIVLKEDKVTSYLQNHCAPKLVITDSQAFHKVEKEVPGSIPLTGFSVVLAHHKGEFEAYVKGTPKLRELRNNDRILMLESCTHLTSCEDIGRVKLPRLIQQFTGKKLQFDFVSGLNQIPDIQQYAMVIQCGGCMVTRKQLHERLRPAIEVGIPVSNYGMVLAYVNGIFNRAVAPFVETVCTPSLS